jgi:hypothetical protein
VGATGTGLRPGDGGLQVSFKLRSQVQCAAFGRTAIARLSWCGPPRARALARPGHGGGGRHAGPSQVARPKPGPGPFSPGGHEAARATAVLNPATPEHATRRSGSGQATGRLVRYPKSEAMGAKFKFELTRVAFALPGHPVP